MTESTATHTFDTLGIAPSILATLQKHNLTSPTPIQLKAIPVAIDGKDIIGIAQTGTGKTFAFGIPMIQRLATFKGRGLVILPTRELAIQVDEALQKIGRGMGMRTAVLIGGENIGKQKRQLAAKPHIIIATPGRLIDHMEQRTVRLDDVSILVLDEADRMLDMGFAPQINRILTAVPKKRQTMLFSATMPADIVKIAATHMELPVRVEVAQQGTAAERVSQELFIVPKHAKTQLLEKLLKEYTGTVLVFSRTKHGAKKIAQSVRDMRYTASEIHANRSLAQRREALEGFRNGKYRVLIATDIAARGIDVKGISLVLNYDLPDNAEDYVHRIGRTGRAGQEGHAISFATPDQQQDIRAIERLIRGTLPRKEHGMTIGAAPARSASDSRDERGQRGYGRSSASSSRGGYGGAARPSGQRAGGGRPLHRGAAAAPARSYSAAPQRAAAPARSTPKPSYNNGIRIDDEDSAPAYRYDPKAGQQSGRGGQRRGR
ncbi:MAG: DEAD/DEAH box helicase [Patescibacteria group bacterium]